MATNKSWSIDDKRLNFQFATEIGWEIKHGKLRADAQELHLHRASRPQFWSSCDAVCDQDALARPGYPNCGKGEPGQTAHAGTALPGALPRRQVGVERCRGAGQGSRERRRGATAHWSWPGRLRRGPGRGA